MKSWLIAYPDEHDRPVVELLTEHEIIAQYWDYWTSNMIKRWGPAAQNMLSHERCIEDWVTVHWAWPSTQRQDNT